MSTVRRAYIESHVPLREAVNLAKVWAGQNAVIHAPDTGAVDANEWLTRLGLRITAVSTKSRFHGSPRGSVIAFCLNVSEVLEVERTAGVESIAVVRAHGPIAHSPTVASHAANRRGVVDRPAALGTVRFRVR